MTQQVTNTSRWQVTNQVATFEANAFRAKVDLSGGSSVGLEDLKLQSVPLAGHLLEITPSSSLALDGLREFYSRGADLVGVYSVKHPRHSWLTAYWRGEIPPSDARYPVGMTLLLSLQTDALDTQPAVTVVSTLAAEAAFALDIEQNRFMEVDQELIVEQPQASSRSAGLVLLRLPGGLLSYCEVVEASDQTALRVDRAELDGFRVTWTLMEGFLEKGVIRRGRVAGVFLARQHDMAAALSWRDEFVSRPVPLTT